MAKRTCVVHPHLGRGEGQGGGGVRKGLGGLQRKYSTTRSDRSEAIRRARQVGGLIWADRAKKMVAIRVIRGQDGRIARAKTLHESGKLRSIATLRGEYRREGGPSLNGKKGPNSSKMLEGVDAHR